MNDSLLKVVEYFISTVGWLAALFMGISTFVELVMMSLPKGAIGEWLSKRGIVGNFLGATLGALTPF